LGDTFVQIQAPTNTSTKLKGITYFKISVGNMLMFQSTIHNITNIEIQEINVVSNRLNFLENMKMTKASRNPHIIQIRLFASSIGKTRSRF
jgi:hypothetical protein